MWTRLAYLTINQAFKPRLEGQSWRGPFISNRYKALLRKQFRLNNIPWIIDPPKDDSKNTRHKQPKGTKHQRTRSMRIAKIKQNLLDAPQKELEYRQIQINNRKLTGMDELIQKTIPYWMSQKAKEAIMLERQAQGKSSSSSVLENEDKRKTFGAKKK